MTAVIEEGLRIFPSAPIGFVRTVPEGGDTVNGHFIPGGVSITQPYLRSGADSGLRQPCPSACGHQRTAREISRILMCSVRSAGWIKRIQPINLGQVMRSQWDQGAALGGSEFLFLKPVFIR